MEEPTGFIPIQNLDIDAQTKITFDLYVNLPLNQRFVLYRKKGDRIDSARLEGLARADVKNFFIHKEDYGEFVKYVALRIRDLISAGDSPQIRQAMTTTARTILSGTFSSGEPAVTEVLINNLNDITSVIIESILERSPTYNKKTFQRFAELAQREQTFKSIR